MFTKRLVVAASLAACFFSQARGQSKLDLSNYQLVFADEFNYSQSTFVNNSDWAFTSPENTIWHGNEPQYYDSSACTVANGYLTIRATRLLTPYNHTDNNVTRVFDYKSGCIRFKPDFTHGDAPTPNEPNQMGFRHGIFEVRCKLAPGQRTWPAFWLYNGAGEIDVFEGYDDKNKLYTNIHNNWVASSPISCQDMYQKDGQDLTQEFHTYTVAWTPDKITFFFDGRETRSVTQSPVVPIAAINAMLLVNLAVNDTLGNPTEPAGWKRRRVSRYSYESYTEMVVDYVRVYKPNSNFTSYPPYKFDNAWKASPLETSPGTGALVTGVPGCVSSNAATNQVIYSGSDGMLRRYYPNGSAYAWELIQPSFWQASMAVQGDVVMGDDDIVFYKGVDNRIQYYYRDQGVWQHAWADYYWEIGDASTRVSDQPGALAVQSGVGNSVIFYRGLDNRLHRLQFTGGGLHGWQHTLLPVDSYTATAAQLVAGDVVVFGSKVAYVGADNRIQGYWDMGGGNYGHTWIDDNFTTAANSVSTQYGSLVAGNDELFYRGLSDNTLRRAYYAGGWHTTPLTTNPDLSLYPVNGKIVYSGQLFYRGQDDKMQVFYPNNGDWTHDWLSSWGYLAPTTALNGDNFSVAANQPIFYKQPNGYMGKFAWGPSEILNPMCTLNPSCMGCLNNPTTVVYRTAGPGGATTAASSGSAARYALYPNPANDVVTLTSAPAAPGDQVLVYDNHGRQVLASPIAANGSTALNVTSLTAGLYVVRVVQKAGVTTLRLALNR